MIYLYYLNCYSLDAGSKKLDMESKVEASEIMEWITFAMAAIAFIFVLQEMDKNAKLEKRIEELEKKIQS